MTAALELQSVQAHYGDAQVLADISLTIAEGEFISVVGSNGAGKTTLIRTIAGMVKPTGGQILFQGMSIAGRECADICEMGIGQVPEGRLVFPTLSVAENLDIGGALKRTRARSKQNLERVYGLFPRLSERRNQKAGSLSGGEQQMLAIGRCLMAEPSLIMLDEPSLGLAPNLAASMFEIVKTLHNEGKTILLVEQNVQECLEYCDRAYVLENGRIVLEGSGAALLEDDRVREAYLGL
ncbi:MAG: ABC transporter ATP-binding protein [Hyphomicrobiales bacterium]|nr:ABC transporter ATP-binding protein [Hyphomicrobiales bacterium]